MLSFKDLKELRDERMFKIQSYLRKIQSIWILPFVKEEYNSCVAFWQFFAKRLFFPDSFSYQKPYQKRSTRTPPELFFLENFTGSAPEITILDRIGNSFGVWRIVKRRRRTF